MAEPRCVDLGRTFVAPVPMNRDETALLIIDMQYHDASPDHGVTLALERLQRSSMRYFSERLERIVIPAIQSLLEYFRYRHMRVIYLTVGSKHRDLRDMPERIRRQVWWIEKHGGIPDLLWTGNQELFDIRKEIEPSPEETVLNKTTWGAFNSTNLDLLLRELGVRTLIITGVSTNCCVESTARDAADRGFACVVVDEATADYDELAHREALRALHANFARIMKSARDVITALEAQIAV